MAYRVEMTRRAERDLSLLYLSIHADESEAAAKWLLGLERAVESLEDRPERCPLAPERRPGLLLRHLLYGKKPHIYRVIFRIADSTVFVLHIRHGARRAAITQRAEDLQ